MISSTTPQRAYRRQWFSFFLAVVSFVVLLPKVLNSETFEQPTPLNVTAPEFVGGPWLNTTGGHPISLASLRGKVVVVHFWTYGCYNCQNNLPVYARWYKQFAGKDVVIVGIHTPETTTERNDTNVEKHIRSFKIEYPVLLDQSETNWRRWQQQYWPTVYLIDRQGKIRFRWIGELNYGSNQGEAKIAQLIEELLMEHTQN